MFEYLLFGYVFIGSISLGYLFLRSGWPKVRSLDESYKIGWSIIIGIIFSVALLILQVLLSLFFSFAKLFFVNLIVLFGVLILALNIRRKFFGKKKVKVAIPKKIIQPKVIEENEDRNVSVAVLSVKEMSQEEIDKLKSFLQKRKEQKVATTEKTIVSKVEQQIPEKKIKKFKVIEEKTKEIEQKPEKKLVPLKAEVVEEKKGFLSKLFKRKPKIVKKEVEKPLPSKEKVAEIRKYLRQKRHEKEVREKEIQKVLKKIKRLKERGILEEKPKAEALKEKKFVKEKETEKEFIPRRMRRFYRQQTHAEKVPETEHISESIFEQLKSMPEEKKMDESIFEQLKKEELEKRRKGISRMPSAIREKRERISEVLKKEDIAESIFEQLEEKKEREHPPKRFRKRETRLPEETKKREKVVEKPAEKPPPIEEREIPTTEKELFPEDEKELKLSDLEIDEDDEFKLLDLDDGIDNITKEIETSKNRCPTCKNKSEEIIYCPNCGTGFCPHCAPQVKQGIEALEYTCPKCKLQVKVKKELA